MEASIPGAGAWFQTLGALCLVVALIFAASWLLRRMQAVRGAQGNTLRLRAGLAVGTRERVVWVQAGDTHLLLGVAPGQVQTLHVFAEPPALEEADSGQAFARLLRAVKPENIKPESIKPESGA